MAGAEDVVDVIASRFAYEVKRRSILEVEAREKDDQIDGLKADVKRLAEQLAEAHDDLALLRGDDPDEGDRDGEDGSGDDDGQEADAVHGGADEVSEVRAGEHQPSVLPGSDESP